jgi:hypothetical protein
VVTTTAPASNNTYHVGLNNYIGNMGPTTKDTYGSGSYSSFVPRIYFNTTAPMTIESARIYVGSSGAVTFNVYNANTGLKVANTTVSVTKTQPSSGTDQGKDYLLNIVFPEAGSFYITPEFNSATLFRNSSAGGSLSYPLSESTGLLSLVSHTGSTTNMNSFYYYLYNFKAKPIGENISARSAVPLTNLTVTEQGNMLVSPIATGNQWYLNGNSINGATSATYQPTQTGDYSVKVTVQDGITITSQIYQFNTLPIKLKDFVAVKRSNGVLVKWTTLSETNNKKFVVERAKDGQNFIPIAEVSPNLARYYSVLDKAPALGINYYKLTQYDYNGTSESFGPIAIDYNLGLANGLTLFENPVKAKFTLQSTSVDKQKQYTIRITDALGKRIKTLKVKGKSLIDGHVVDVVGLAAGIYTVDIMAAQGAGKAYAKFIKL